MAKARRNGGGTLMKQLLDTEMRAQMGDDHDYNALPSIHNMRVAILPCLECEYGGEGCMWQEENGQLTLACGEIHNESQQW